MKPLKQRRPVSWWVGVENFLLVMTDPFTLLSSNKGGESRHQPTANTEQAMPAARVQGKHGWSHPIVALISLEIFSLDLMGFGSGAKEATLHCPDLLILSTEQTIQPQVSIFACLYTMEDTIVPPNPHMNNLNSHLILNILMRRMSKVGKKRK